MKDKKNGMRTLVMRLFARHAGVPLEQMELSLNAMQTLSALERQLHVSDDPEEIAQWTMKVACEFYGADWCGFLQADLELGIWTPFWWYITSTSDKTLELTQEFETAASMPRWVAALRENTHIAIPDTEEIKESTPEEYAVYKRLRIRSVLAVPVAPRPVGFLAVRNPTRYCDDPVMLRMLAVVILNAVNQHSYMESAKMSLSPETIESDKDVIINLFGSLEIYTSKGVLHEADIKSPKISRLVAYLLLHKRSVVPPRDIAAAVWPEESFDTDNPGKNLKGLIYRLRQRFSLISSYPLIETTPNGYRLNPGLHITTDLQMFDQYCEAANQTISPVDKIVLMDKAIRIYRGNVLSQADGEHWLLNTASHYSLRYLGIVNELLKLLAERQDYQGVHKYATQSLTIEPGNMRAYYWLILSMQAKGATEMVRCELNLAQQHLTAEDYGELLASLGI